MKGVIHSSQSSREKKPSLTSPPPCRRFADVREGRDRGGLSGGHYRYSLPFIPAEASIACNV